MVSLADFGQARPGPGSATLGEDLEPDPWALGWVWPNLVKNGHFLDLVKHGQFLVIFDQDRSALARTWSGGLV